MSVCPTLVTLPIGMPFGKSELERSGPPARRHDLVPDADDVLLADAVEHERLARAARVADDSGCAGPQVDRGCSCRLVGEQLHPCEIGRDACDDADEAVGGDRRVVQADAVARARGDDDRLRERARRPARDLRDDGVEVSGEARAVDVVELRAQVLVLLQRELALDCPLQEVAVLLAEPFGLVARGEQAVGPAVGVTERLRDALEPDREGPERPSRRPTRRR